MWLKVQQADGLLMFLQTQIDIWLSANALSCEGEKKEKQERSDYSPRACYFSYFKFHFLLAVHQRLSTVISLPSHHPTCPHFLSSPCGVFVIPLPSLQIRETNPLYVKLYLNWAKLQTHCIYCVCLFFFCVRNHVLFTICYIYSLYLASIRFLASLIFHSFGKAFSCILQCFTSSAQLKPSGKMITA